MTTFQSWNRGICYRSVLLDEFSKSLLILRSYKLWTKFDVIMYFFIIFVYLAVVKNYFMHYLDQKKSKQMAIWVGCRSFLQENSRCSIWTPWESHPKMECLMPSLRLADGIGISAGWQCCFFSHAWILKFASTGSVSAPFQFEPPPTSHVDDRCRSCSCSFYSVGSI